MSKWLTTGQMIDELHIGEEAECINDCSFKGIKVKRSENGLTFYKSGQDFVITKLALEAEWRILPNYVSFQKAINAMLKGKKVIMHYDGQEHEFHYDKRLHTFDHGAFSLMMLDDAKWTIEE